MPEIDCGHDEVTDLETLMQSIAQGDHDIDLDDFESRLGLPVGWDWEDVVYRVEHGELTAQDIDDAIHRGLS